MSYQFFVNDNQIFDNHVQIVGKDVSHIRNVLRMKVGEEISVVVSGSDNEYRCGIKEFTEDTVECDLLFVKEADVELPAKVYLFQALPKQDKMELIIQKAVELGVHEVIPVATKRCVVKLEGAKESKKIDRWNMISEAAAKQSKRRIIPKVSGIMSMKEALAYCKDMKVKLIPYELVDNDAMNVTRDILETIASGDEVAVFIGPEGGFTVEEVDEAMAAGAKAITLGKRILRTETAGFVVLSWINYLLG